MTEKANKIENFTDVLNIVYDNNNIVQDFKCKYNTWFKVFSSEWKLSEWTKSQALVHLKLSLLSRILVTAIISICVLENYAKFDKSYAVLGISLYLTMVVMNFVSNIVIMYYSLQNEYISDVIQHFKNVFAMFQIIKFRLKVLQKRCNWNIKLSSFLEGELVRNNQITSFATLFSSAFCLYNIYGIAVGTIIFLLCQYLQYEIFEILKISVFFLLFAVAIAKDIKIFRLFGKLKESTKFMKNVTIDFLIWFENNCEMRDILQQYEAVSKCITDLSDLFPSRLLKICRKPRQLNFAVAITACEVFAGLCLSRNDLEIVITFLTYGDNAVLDELTVKTVNTKVVEQSSDENTVKEEYQSSHLPALARNLGHSKDILENNSRAEKDNIFQSTARAHFINKNFKVISKRLNKKGSFKSKYIAKASSFSSKSKTSATIKKKSRARRFDENLPFRFELRKTEAQEEMFSGEKSNLDVTEIDKHTICTDKLLTDKSENNGMAHFGFCNESSASKIVLCKSCLEDLNLNLTLPIVSDQESHQNKVDFDENVRENFLKEIELNSEIDESFKNYCKDTSPGVDKNKTKKDTSITEPFASDFHKITDANSHEHIKNETKSEKESGIIDKDIIFRPNSNNPIKSTDKCLITSDVGHHKSDGSYTIEERKTSTDENGLLKNQFEASVRSNQLNKSNSIDETNKTHLFDNTPKSVCQNMVEESLVRSNTDESPENAFSDISECDVYEQTQNNFIGETFSDELIGDSELNLRNKNLYENDLNVTSDSYSFEDMPYENKPDVECMIKSKQTLFDEYISNPSEVTDSISFSTTIIKEAKISANIHEKSGSEYCENRLGQNLHEQKSSETKIMAEHEIVDKNFVSNDISNNTNEKNILDHDTCSSKNVCSSLIKDSEIHLKKSNIDKQVFNEISGSAANEIEGNGKSNIDKNIEFDDVIHHSVEIIETCTNFIDIVQNVDRTDDSNDLVSNHEDVIDSLSKCMESCLNIGEKSESNNKNKKIDFSQKLKDESQLDLEFEVVSKNIAKNEHNINQTDEINPENQSKFMFEQDDLKMVKNISDFRPHVIDPQNINNDVLSMKNKREIPENCLESTNSNTSKDVSFNDSSKSFPNVSKENYTRENGNEEKNQNVEIDDMEVFKVKPPDLKKNSGKKNDRKRSQKERNLKNKDTVKTFSNSVDAVENSSDIKETSTIKLDYPENEDFMTSDVKTFSLTDKIDKNVSDILKVNSEKIKEDMNVEKDRCLLQPQMFNNLTEDDIESTALEIYQYFINNKQEQKNDKPIDSLINENYHTDPQDFSDGTNNFYSLFQRGDSVVSEAENTDVIIPRNILVALENKNDVKQEERSCRINNKSAITCNDDMFLFETPSFDGKSLWNSNKNASSLEDVLAQSNAIGVNEGDCATPHTTNSRILGQSEKGMPTVGIPIDNTQSNCALMEKPKRIIIKGKRISKNIKNEKDISCFTETSAENTYCTKINIDEDNKSNTIIDNVLSLNERKILLAEQLPIKTGDTESEASFSEKSLCQELVKGYHSNNIEKVENGSKESASNTKNISNSVTCEDDVIPEKSTTHMEIEVNQPKDEEPFEIKNVTNDDANISKCNELTNTRNSLIRLWKGEKNKLVDIFPKYRHALKRKIIHLEKKLSKDGKSDICKLSAVNIQENEYIFRTVEGDKPYFSSSLEVSCRYPDAEYSESNGKNIQKWLRSIATTNTNEPSLSAENSKGSLVASTHDSNFFDEECCFNSDPNVKEEVGDSASPFIKSQEVILHTSNYSLGNESEISEEALHYSKTPLTGSSEDPNFHFHESTSPSGSNSFISEESEVIAQSSTGVSTNQTSYECAEIQRDKNTSRDVKTNSCGKKSESFDGIQWVSEIVPTGKTQTISLSQPISCSNPTKSPTSRRIPNTKKNSKTKKITMKNRNEKSEYVKGSDLIFPESGALLNVCSNDIDGMTSDVHMNSSEDFVSLSDNYDNNQSYLEETNETDPLKYHLKYKNIDLHVLDSSSSITIRLIDEDYDSNATLTPKWRRLDACSLSSSNSSINELLLQSTLSSYSSGDAIKDDINITEGKLKMVVGKNDSDDISILSETHSLTNKLSSQKIGGEINASKNIDDDTLIFVQENDDCADENNQHKNKDPTSLFESDKFQNYVANCTSKCEANDSVADDNRVLETSVKEIEILPSCSFNKSGGRIGEHSEVNKFTDTVTVSASDTHKKQFGISEHCSFRMKSAVVKEDESSDDFYFETKRIRLTSKPNMESGSVEIKFRQLKDKTRLTFKSGCKKLYLKMASPK